MGRAVGSAVGLEEGPGVGIDVGLLVGEEVGGLVGFSEGLWVGDSTGLSVGCAVGVSVGDSVGLLVGDLLGLRVVGETVGSIVTQISSHFPSGQYALPSTPVMPSTPLPVLPPEASSPSKIMIGAVVPNTPEQQSIKES